MRAPAAPVCGCRRVNLRFVGSSSIASPDWGIYVVGASITIRGNYIGTDKTGAVDQGNGAEGIYLTGVSSGGITIGGTTAAERNVISGNAYDGIRIQQGSLNLITGNFVGTNAAGTAAIPNGGNGISIVTQANQVGSAVPGGGNLVSGNGGAGIELDNNACFVFGNTVGLDVNGTTAIPNVGEGITIYGDSNTIGGTSSLQWNVVSGNGYDGFFLGNDASGNSLIGNRIGTNAAGTGAVGNKYYAIRVYGASGNTFGGMTAAEGNLMSGNGRGVSIEQGAHDNVFVSNVVGLDVNGALLPNHGSGIDIGGPNNTVGLPGAGNVLSGNDYPGLTIQNGQAYGNTIQANKIGTTADGTSARPNGYMGIRVYGGHDNLIGGTGAGEGNLIAFNPWYGIFLDFGERTSILGNSIHSNGGWGIDIAPYGPNLNDPGDIDGGPNHAQNFPILSSVVVAGNQTQVTGELSSAPSSTYRIEFFSNPQCDPSGFGQGKTFLGAVDVQTNAAGIATIAANLPVAAGAPFVTATATNPDLETSEFSPCAAVGGANPGTIQFTQEQYVGYENAPNGVVTVTVGRMGGVAGTASAHYATSSQGATPGVDYTETSGTVTFGPGEVLKTFEVPVVFDLDPEGQENIGLTLSNPTGGAQLGAATSKIALIDYSPTLPTAYVSDAMLIEGDSGSANMEFTITLSPGNQPVTVSYNTVDGTALSGVDYQATSGQVIFAPGDGPKKVTVPVFGDTAVEGNEIFYLVINGVQTGTVTDGFGEGVIVDDDGLAQPPSPVCVGGKTIAKPKIVISNLGAPSGDEKISFTGKLAFAPGQPIGFDSLDMAARGAQVLIEDLGSGAQAIVDLTYKTAAVPSGMLGHPCDASLSDGWTVNGASTVFAYKNASNELPDASCAAGSAQDLARLRLADRRASTGKIKLTARTRATTIATPVGPLRATIVLGADAATGFSGACGTKSFTGTPVHARCSGLDADLQVKLLGGSGCRTPDATPSRPPQPGRAERSAR